MGIVDIPITVPSWNAAFRIRQGGGMYKTEEAKAFQEAVAWAYKGDMHEGDVEIFIEFWRKRDMDSDNVEKLTRDALQGRAYKNDKQIVKWGGEKHTGKNCEGEDWLYVSVNSV